MMDENWVQKTTSGTALIKSSKLRDLNITDMLLDNFSELTDKLKSGKLETVGVFMREIQREMKKDTVFFNRKKIDMLAESIEAMDSSKEEMRKTGSDAYMDTFNKTINILRTLSNEITNAKNPNEINL